MVGGLSQRWLTGRRREVASGAGHSSLTPPRRAVAAVDHQFRIGSVTKTFTTAVVLQLVAEGALRLDDPIARHLPGVVQGEGEMTVRHLLR